MKIHILHNWWLCKDNVWASTAGKAREDQHNISACLTFNSLHSFNLLKLAYSPLSFTYPILSNPFELECTVLQFSLPLSNQ